MTFPIPDDSGFVPVPGGRIWYRMNHGKNQKAALIVIHGGPGFSHHYLLPLLDMCQDRTVILYDQLDAGASDRPCNPQNWHIDRFVAEIACLRQHLSLDKVCLFGNSWGGTIASAYAATRPEGLESMILSSPLIHTNQWIADNLVHRKSLPKKIVAALDYGECHEETTSSNYLDAVSFFNHRHFCRLTCWPSYVKKSIKLLNDTCYETMWGPNEFTCTGTLADYDGRNLLPKINCPVLFTAGEFDEATPTACETFAAHIENATLEIIPGSSHLAFVEQRNLYMSTIKIFLYKNSI